MDENLKTLLFEQWSNPAALGYAREAMRLAGLSQDQAEAVLDEMAWLFDMMTLDEAEKALTKTWKKE